MPQQPHSKPTIMSMAVIASAIATFLHEGVGHGGVACLRGAVPTELTSNHLSALHQDRWVDAAGTLVNLAAGGLSLALSRKTQSENRKYFFWILAALNLLPGAGYFLFSGILGLGDWQEVIRGLPHEGLWRIAMSLVGALLYVWFVRLLAVAVQPFCADRGQYNIIGRLPYLAACVFSCLAGSLDPLGIQLFFLSTVPAAFGGSSGLLWADSLFSKTAPSETFQVRPQPSWGIAATAIGLAYIFILGPGIQFGHNS